MRFFPFYPQPPGSKYCGAVCLQMVASYYGKTHLISHLIECTQTGESGTDLRKIKQAAKKIGLEAHGYKLTWEQFLRTEAVPCIVPWGGQHFVVAYSITYNGVLVADPGKGLGRVSKWEFLRRWIVAPGNNNEKGGIILFLTLPSR